jgi:hypothetical protein
VLRALNRWFWEDLVLQAAGEVVVAVAACLLLLGTSWAVVWGYDRAPKSTVALGTGVVCLFVYGAVVLLRGRLGAPKGVLASVAAAFCLFFVVWAIYVIQYCSCR